MRPIRVLVVDDSALMRRVVRTIVERAGSLAFVGQAGSGDEAMRLITALDPDVVTLDVEMPAMDGLAVLEWIMRERPRPVVMLSYLTQAGGEAAMRALTLAGPAPGSSGAARPDASSAAARGSYWIVHRRAAGAGGCRTYPADVKRSGLRACAAHARLANPLAGGSSGASDRPSTSP